MPQKTIAVSVDVLVLDAFNAVLAQNFVLNRSALIQEFMMDTIRKNPVIYADLQYRRAQELLFTVTK